MSRYAPSGREFWSGYFDPDVQRDVDGVADKSKEASMMRNFVQSVEGGAETTPLGMIMEISDIAGIKADDGLLKSQIPELKGSHFTPEEARLIYVGLSASSAFDEMDLIADGV